jgi:hypothetical protein
VAIAAFEDYLKDKKLRIMALRPRADLRALIADPQLPHRAATAALVGARASHIPYDFTMDYENHSRIFCSEVASAAYQQVGLTLWMGRSYLSSPGVRAWLGLFGARHLETQEPADLEYDPQLQVVAEWRDPGTLWQDHLDNAGRSSGFTWLTRKRGHPCPRQPPDGVGEAKTTGCTCVCAVIEPLFGGRVFRGAGSCARCAVDC